MLMDSLAFGDHFSVNFSLRSTNYIPSNTYKTLGISGFDRAYRSRFLTQSIENLNALGFDDNQAIALLNKMSGGVR